jgi:hypothetical protein
LKLIPSAILLFKSTETETRDEFKAPIEWQHQVSAELSELRKRVRKERKIFLKNNKAENKVEFVSYDFKFQDFFK